MEMVYPIVQNTVGYLINLKLASRMAHARMHIYIVVENGDPYLVAYTTYDAAVAAVKIKHKETLDEDLKYSEEYGESCHEVDVPEAASGETHLYIEKGISIYIYRLPIL